MGIYSNKISRRRKSTPWTNFEQVPSATPGDPSPCYVNSLYQVSVTTHKSGWEHLSIVRRDREALHDWRHLQRIKNEICGREREAVEIYPAESRLVDTNNQYHLWVAPEGQGVPIGYADRDVSDVQIGAHKQRPFDEAPEGLNESSRAIDARVDVWFPVPEETSKERK